MVLCHRKACYEAMNDGNGEHDIIDRRLQGRTKKLGVLQRWLSALTRTSQAQSCKVRHSAVRISHDVVVAFLLFLRGAGLSSCFCCLLVGSRMRTPGAADGLKRLHTSTDASFEEHRDITAIVKIATGSDSDCDRSHVCGDKCSENPCCTAAVVNN